MSKSPYVWSSLSPRKAGLYWMRDSEEHEPSIVRVFHEPGDGGMLSYQYGDLDQDPQDESAGVNWVCNACEKAEWAFIPKPH